MAEKCPACGSCGMPMERPEDFALGDVTRPYCRHCTDAHGELLPFDQVLATNARFYVESQGVTPAAADAMARAMSRICPRGAIGSKNSTQKKFGKRKSTRRRELCLITSCSR